MSYSNLIVNPAYGVMGSPRDPAAQWGILRMPAPRLRGDKQGWTASATFWCTTGNLINFCTLAGGAPQVITTSWGSMSRIQTLQHPAFAGLYATTIDTEATGNPNPNPGFVGLYDQFSHNRVMIEFSSYPYGIAGDSAYYTLSSKGGGVYTPIPGWGKYSFVATGEKLTEDAATFVGQTSYVLTIQQAPSLNDAAMDALMGKVNIAPFLGKPALQLKFDSWEGDLSATIGGVVQYVRKVYLTYQSYPWTMLYRSDGVLDTPVDGSGNLIVNTADFTSMFN